MLLQTKCGDNMFVFGGRRYFGGLAVFSPKLVVNKEPEWPELQKIEN